MKDPAFKLFGKTIPMKEEEDLSPRIPSSCNEGEASLAFESSQTDDDKTAINKKVEPASASDVPKSHDLEVYQNCADNKNSEEDCKEPKKEKPFTESNEGVKLENKEADAKTSDNQEKASKKPEKLLPCPRCDSMDTKFCYYNNYNVNQPRHFCKNCQRYWTAGGTMRNVPVGAGRRKNKNSSSQYRHTMISDGVTTGRIDASDVSHHQVIPPTIASSARVLNGSSIQLFPLDVESGRARVLTFGPDAPLCDSMTAALNIADQTAKGRKNLKDEEKGSPVGVENIDDQSCGSSTSVSTSTEKEGNSKAFEPVTKDQSGMPGWPNGISSQQPFYGGCPWLYGWNFSWGNATSNTAPAQLYINGKSNANGVSWNNGNSDTGPTGMWAAAAGFPWPFIPATYWPGPPGWLGGTWNVPFSPFTTPNGVSSAPCSSSNPGSPTLGKHSRDFPESEDKQEGSLWVPKTLRIDDPDEAAKSSIWTTLGIGSKPESITTGGIFKAFHSKTEENGAIKASPQGLLANPAALSRSMAFQESG